MSFGSIAEDYDDLRPQPLQQVVDWLVPTGCEMAVDDAVAMLGTYSRGIVASPDDRAHGLAEACAGLTARFPGAATIDIPMQAGCRRADRIVRGLSASES
jgi:hypothetical protein